MKKRSHSSCSLLSDSGHLESPELTRQKSVGDHYTSLLNCLRYHDVDLFVKSLENFRQSLFRAASEKAMCYSSDQLERDIQKKQHQFQLQQYYALNILDDLTKHYHLDITSDYHYVNQYGDPIKISEEDYAFLTYLNAALYQVNFEISEGDTHPLVRYANESNFTSLTAHTDLQEWYQQQGIPTPSNEPQALYDGMCNFYVKSGLLIFTSRFLVNSVEVEKIHYDDEIVQAYKRQLPPLIDQHVRIETGCAMSAQMKKCLLADVKQIKASVQQKRSKCSFFQCRARAVYSRRLSHIDHLVDQLSTSKTAENQAIDLGAFLVDFSRLMNEHTNLLSALFAFKKTDTAIEVDCLLRRYHHLTIHSDEMRRELKTQVGWH